MPGLRRLYSLAITIINFDTNFGFPQRCPELIDLLHVFCSIFRVHLGGQADRNQDCLDLSHSGGEDEALIISVQHDHDANDTG